MVTPDWLKKIDVFKGLTDEQYEKIASACGEMNYKQGEFVTRKGDPSNALYILAEGACDVKVELGRYSQFTVHQLNPGDVFGELGFIDAKPRSADIICVRPSKIVVLLRDELMKLAEDDPKLGFTLIMRLTKKICERLRRTNEQFQNFYLKASVVFKEMFR